MFAYLHGGAMANRLCLVFFFVLSFLPSFSFSAIPVGTVTEYYALFYGKSGWFSTPAAACSNLFFVSRHQAYTISTVTASVPDATSSYCVLTIAHVTANTRTESTERAYFVTRTVPGSCPSNSSLIDGACVCASGYAEQGNQCVKVRDPVCGPLSDMSMGVSSVESDFGKQSTGWASSALGTSGKACIQGCQISGTIGGCVIGGSAICMVNDPKFTGEACDTKTEGDSNDGCPADTILQPVSGLCVPKQNSCPAGQEPSKYVEGICIPQETANDGKCEDPSDPAKRVDCQGTDSKCPSGKVPSKVTPNTCVPALDGAEQSKNGNTYECTGGKCTVIKGDCTPAEGNTCKEEKTQGDACKEAPDLKQCTDDTGITGSCAGAFQCKGDGLQCAMALEQHKRNCELFEKQNDYSRLFDELKAGQTNDGAIQGTEVDLAGHFKVDSVIGNGVCPADITVMVMDRPIPVRLSDFCQYFNAMGYLLFLGACISCLRILGT